MIDVIRAKAMREKAIEHLKAALAIATEIKDATTGFIIERAIDQLRADLWPGDLASSE